MAQVKVTTSRTVPGDPDAVFAALADYAGTRPRLLTEHFSEYEVRAGGQGAGTTVHWRLQATSKRVRDCLIQVTEPAARTLAEQDTNSSMLTTWTVTPPASTGPDSAPSAGPAVGPSAGSGAGSGAGSQVAAGSGSVVQVVTTWQGAGGVGGFFERTFAPIGLRRIYDEMLGKLADTVAPRS